MNVIQTLGDFVEVALKNRKYPLNSVYGYRAALKLYDRELNSDERESLDLFKERLEQIHSNVLAKNKNDFSISSLEVYRKRIKKILDDYEQYGVDPSKMANWNPRTRRSKVGYKSQANKEVSKEERPDESDPVSLEGNSRHEYSLRQSKKIIISYPSDFTRDEAESIKSFADYLVSIRIGDKSHN